MSSPSTPPPPDPTPGPSESEADADSSSTESEQLPSSDPPPPPPSSSSVSSSDNASSSSEPTPSESESSSSSSSSQEPSTTPEPSSPSPTSAPWSMSESTLTEDSTSLSRSDVIWTSDGHIYTSTITSTHILPAGSVIAVPIDAADPNTGSAPSNKGAIAGGVVGGVAFVLLAVVAGAWGWRRWERKRQEREFDGNFDPAFVGVGSPRTKKSFSGGDFGDDGGDDEGAAGVTAASSATGSGKRASWRKRLSTRVGSKADFDEAHVEGGTLPRVHLDDEDDLYSPASSPSPPPTAMSMSDSRMSTHGPSLGAGSMLYPHSTGSSGGMLPLSHSGSIASFGGAGAPMGVSRHGSVSAAHGSVSAAHSRSSSPPVSFAGGTRAISPALYSGASSPPLYSGASR